MKQEVLCLARRCGRFALAELALATVFALGGPAQAAPQAGAYAAVLAAPTAQRQAVIDGVLWKCAGEQCSAPAQGGRAVPTCGRVARKFGPVARFTAPQGELTSEELTRCNAAK